MLYDVVLLRTYVAVCDAQSFTRAANEVHLTQSAVSLQVKRLEEQVGLPLIIRGSNGLNLTEEGEIVLHYARRILSLCVEAKQRITHCVEPVIRIAASECFHLRELNEIIKKFQSNEPSIRVQVELIAEAHVADFDIVISAAEIDQDVGVTLCRERRVWAAGSRFDFEAQAILPLALSPPPERWREVLLDRLVALDRPWHIVLQSKSVNGIVSASKADLAISILPYYMVDEDLKILGKNEGLPALPDFNFVLRQEKKSTSLSHGLAAAIIAHFCNSKIRDHHHYGKDADVASQNHFYLTAPFL